MYWRRLLCWACMIGWAQVAGAVTLWYGNWLQVQHISRQDGRLQMPLSRKKYANVRLLDKKLYQFLLECKTPCRFDVKENQWKLVSLRAAKTRPNMWIAEAEINEQLNLTFLIFKEKDTYQLKPPQEVLFTDKKLLKQIYSQIVEKIQAL